METTSNDSREESWKVFGRNVPKTEIQYLSQVIIIYIVVITSIFNLSINTGKDNSVWTALLSSCLGYMLPNPSIKKHRNAQP